MKMNDLQASNAPKRPEPPIKIAQTLYLEAQTQENLKSAEKEGLKAKAISTTTRQTLVCKKADTDHDHVRTWKLGHWQPRR